MVHRDLEGWLLLARAPKLGKYPVLIHDSLEFGLEYPQRLPCSSRVVECAAREDVMRRITLYRSGLRATPFAIFCALVLACSTGSPAFAQHAGGHAGGAGHVSPPPAYHPPVSRPIIPMRSPLAGPGSRTGFTSPIRIYSPPSFAVGYPFTRRRISPRFPFHPIAPVPIVPPYNFGLFGIPFFGLGFGWGFNSGVWTGCDQFWMWGYGCNGLPLYESGPEYNVFPLEPSLPQPQWEIQTWPAYYAGENPAHVELYLTDGTVYSVTDYWLVNGELHFKVIEENGTKVVEHTIDFNQLDLQKTIDVNTARGFRFVLRNEPIEQYLKDNPSMGEPDEDLVEPAPTGSVQPAPPGPIHPAP
jgi:hypothetical protein